jgi:hypothetical protein
MQLTATYTAHRTEHTSPAQHTAHVYTRVQIVDCLLPSVSNVSKTYICFHISYLVALKTLDMLYTKTFLNIPTYSQCKVRRNHKGKGYTDVLHTYTYIQYKNHSQPPRGVSSTKKRATLELSHN